MDSDNLKKKMKTFSDGYWGQINEGLEDWIWKTGWTQEEPMRGDQEGQINSDYYLYHCIPPTAFLDWGSVQLLRCVWLFATPWTAARQVSLSITNSWSLLKLMSIESVMPYSHLILCCPLLLPSIFPSTMVFSKESIIPIRWPKYWSCSFSISPSNEYSGMTSFRID